MISKRSGWSVVGVASLFMGGVVVLYSQTPSLFGLDLSCGGGAARFCVRTVTAPA
ncbi:MAG: hypothetical protein OXF75_09205 [Acidimicrobiaceae bacterium]|nr:hypothetical protein [Acidimicrobiaceae bacterium]